jgi:hypothetical protein
VAPAFSQIPTLGEFIARARHYGYTRHTIRIPELGARLVYLRRVRRTAVELVDLPPMRESDRLTRRAIEDLCRRADIPAEDFGL